MQRHKELTLRVAFEELCGNEKEECLYEDDFKEIFKFIDLIKELEVADFEVQVNFTSKPCYEKIHEIFSPMAEYVIQNHKDSSLLKVDIDIIPGSDVQNIKADIEIEGPSNETQSQKDM